MKKLAGVKKIASAVLMAVRDTESSMLAFDRDDMKLEILPPGHEATRIMPRPIIGEIQFPIEIASRKVKAGNRIS